jgi:ABC-type transporter Mla MlaB component
VLDVHHSGNSWQLAGSLDADGGIALLREVERWRADVRIDASRVQRIDGAGLTALAVARQQCRADGHTFAVTEVAPDALRELRVGARLLELFGPPGVETGAASPDVEAVPEHDEPASRARRAQQRRFLHLRRRHDGTTR